MPPDLDNIVKEYTEALRSGEWKVSFGEYRGKKSAGKMGRKPTNETRSGIQKRVSQKPYERKLQKKAKMLPTEHDQLEEEEGNDLETGEGAPVQNKGIPEEKNRKIPSETISDQNQSQRPVYEYDESYMGLFIQIAQSPCWFRP
jgi:hypothetical protein